MAKSADKTTANKELEIAINRVLTEEQAARSDVDAMKAQAQVLLNEAQNQAQQIQRRTDERIRRIQTLCDTAIAIHVNQLQHDQNQTGAQVTLASDTDDMLSKAVAEITRRLTTLNNKG